MLLPFQKVASEWRLGIMNHFSSLPEGRSDGALQIASNS